VHAPELRARVAEQLAGARVGLDQLAVGVADEDRVRGLLDQLAVRVLALAERREVLPRLLDRRADQEPGAGEREAEPVEVQHADAGVLVDEDAVPARGADHRAQDHERGDRRDAALPEADRRPHQERERQIVEPEQRPRPDPLSLHDQAQEQRAGPEQRRLEHACGAQARPRAAGPGQHHGRAEHRAGRDRAGRDCERLRVGIREQLAREQHAERELERAQHRHHYVRDEQKLEHAAHAEQRRGVAAPQLPERGRHHDRDHQRGGQHDRAHVAARDPARVEQGAERDRGPVAHAEHDQDREREARPRPQQIARHAPGREHEPEPREREVRNPDRRADDQRMEPAPWAVRLLGHHSNSWDRGWDLGGGGGNRTRVRASVPRKSYRRVRPCRSRAPPLRPAGSPARQPGRISSAAPGRGVGPACDF